jgi:nucleotide-binding universal stress UspA family protein
MKFEHILFPVDFSERTARLNPSVEWMATHFDSRVTLLHVVEIPSNWYGASDAPLLTAKSFQAISESAKSRLRDYAIRLPENRVERVLAEDETAGHITSWAKEHGVDLIMMGTHGYGKIRGLLLGSVASKVIHDAECPVWTDSLLHAHMEGEQHKISSILCAVDIDAETVPLLRFAGQLAAEFKAPVHVLHVVPEAESRPAKYLDFDLHRYLKESAHAEIAKRQQEAGTDFPVEIGGQAISAAVSEIALEKHCDLVLIGRGQAQKRLGYLRTHAYQIIRDAPCPVLSYLPNRQD